jgi:parallel beta-helix repeat protein
VVSGNAADSGGGGMYAWNCDVTVVSSTLSGNQARDFVGGGAFLGQGTGEFRNSTVSGNTALSDVGGGISLYAEEFTADNSTVSGNTSLYAGGGVASFYADVTLNQVTITNNQALEAPTPSATATLVGGVAILPRIESGASSSEHSGGGHSAAAQEVHANGTIIAGNAGTDVGIIGTLFSDHSLIGTVEGTTLTDQGGTILGADPVLGPLASNGGPTQTHALLTGSPAIDHGPVPVPVFPGNENDQREAGFARVVNGTVDIGAFEVQAPPAPPEPAPLVITPRFTG